MVPRVKKVFRIPDIELMVAEAAVEAAKTRLVIAVEAFVLAEEKRIAAELRLAIGKAKP